MRSTIVFVAALFLCGLARAAADEEVIRHMLRDAQGITAEEIRKSYDDCDGTTLSMRICGAYRVAVQDLRLKRAYSQASALAKERGVEASLQTAERAWLSYRDSQCAFEGENGAGGGSAQPLHVLSCKEDLTKLQADRLESGLVQR